MMNHLGAIAAYPSARPAITPGAPADPVQRLGQAAEDFAQQMNQVDQVATGAMTGSVETHRLVQTIAEAELALETVVAIRDKVVEAYQEILRMPV